MKILLLTIWRGFRHKHAVIVALAALQLGLTLYLDGVLVKGPLPTLQVNSFLQGMLFAYWAREGF